MGAAMGIIGSVVGGAASGGGGNKNPMEKLQKPLKMLEQLNPMKLMGGMSEGAKGGPG